MQSYVYSYVSTYTVYCDSRAGNLATWSSIPFVLSSLAAPSAETSSTALAPPREKQICKQQQKQNKEKYRGITTKRDVRLHGQVLKLQLNGKHLTCGSLCNLATTCSWIVLESFVGNEQWHRAHVPFLSVFSDECVTVLQ